MKYLDEEGLKTYHNGIKEKISALQTSVDKTYLTDQKRYAYHLELTNDVSDNSTIDIATNYEVGADVLEVYFMGTLLTKDEHYLEVGNNGDISSSIQINSWGDTIDSGLYFDFIIIGTYGSERATKLAQIEYGIDDNTVYYRIDAQASSTIYYVEVRDKTTTATLKYYIVNIETGEVTE